MKPTLFQPTNLLRFARPTLPSLSIDNSTSSERVFPCYRFENRDEFVVKPTFVRAEFHAGQIAGRAKKETVLERK